MLTAVLISTGCRTGVEPSAPSPTCLETRTHLVFLQLPPGEPGRDMHARTMERAMGEPFIAHCERAMTNAQRECILATTDITAALACSGTAVSTNTQPSADKGPQ